MRLDDLQAQRDPAALSIGHRFVAALAVRDAPALLAMFGQEVDFRGLTPGRAWEAQTATAAVEEVILGQWFEPSDVIEKVEAVETGTVGDRHRLGYRLLGTNSDGHFIVEQQAFFDLSQGKITWMRVLCSGFRSVPSTEPLPEAGG
jgi:hypothetical protein